MPISFLADTKPDVARFRELRALAPSNPFSTPEFAEANPAQERWVVGLVDGSSFVSGCTAFLHRGRRGRELSIHSLAPLGEHHSVFWNGLVALCRRERIAALTVNTFGSEAGAIPTVARERWRQPRSELLLDLAADIRSGLSSNHKRNLRRGEMSGFQVRMTRDVEHCAVHLGMMAASTNRREARGETVAQAASKELFARLLASGAGTLYQATRSGLTVSSILILQAERGAYYHSAGTAREGMEAGASHFLIVHCAEHLKRVGCLSFNLGGVSPGEDGLERFKRGFGARPVDLEAAGFSFRRPFVDATLDALDAIMDMRWPSRRMQRE